MRVDNERAPSISSGAEEPFDVVLQRATNHAWVNRSDEPALLMAVLIDHPEAYAGGAAT
jgi:hypothetical protein